MQFNKVKLRLCAVVLCFSSIIGYSFSLEWVVDDAVYITAEIETRSPEESSSLGYDDDGRLPGKCLKLRECYPIFFLTDVKGGNSQLPISINSELLDFILETIELCEPTEGSNSTSANSTGTVKTDKYDEFVWCRLRSVPEKNSTSKPTERQESLIIGSSTKPTSIIIDSSTKPTSIIFGSKATSEDGGCGQVSNKLPQHEDMSASTGAGERVVGGKDVAPGEAPYAVCGGSIIDEQHILTAAHCVSHFRPTVLQYVRLLIGDHDIKDPSDTELQERNVSKIIYHKEFASDTLHSDIAMIKLSEPVQYTSNVGVVCLADNSQPFDDGTTFAKLVGWGQISDGGERPSVPRTAQLRIWKPEDCEDVYEEVIADDILDKAFCAGGFQEGGTTDACRGDSGGPLTIVRNDRIEQVGIVSFGIGCGRYPGVFTKVSEYQSWMDRHRVY